MKVEENIMHSLIELQLLRLCECFKIGFYIFMIYMLDKSSKI